jgi:Holliday junction resolvasome RuvABC endonuclease subunit
MRNPTNPEVERIAPSAATSAPDPRAGGQPSSPARRSGEEGTQTRAALAVGAPASGPDALGEEGPGPLVIGLDLSMTATGMAHTDGHTETIATMAKDGDLRLRHIRVHIDDYLHRNPVELVVIEDVPPIRANSLAIIGMVHGVVRDLLWFYGAPYALVPPASAKKYATGRGNATKPDMRMALFQRAGLDLRDDNQVDAWWLRAMGLDYLGQPPVTLPKEQRKALDKVAWPEVRH